MASPVTVFYYEKHDPNARRFVRSARPATREVIAKIGARAVSGLHWKWTPPVWIAKAI